jgi:hypothetical protein
MKTNMLKRARELWNVSNVPREINRSNQRKWIRGLRILGDKWLYAQHMEKPNAIQSRA